MCVYVCTQVRNEFYKDSQGCILTYDVTNRASFEALQSWLNEAREYGADNMVRVVHTHTHARTHTHTQVPTDTGILTSRHGRLSVRATRSWASRSHVLHGAKCVQTCVCVCASLQVICVAATKADLLNRKVSEKEGRDWAAGQVRSHTGTHTHTHTHTVGKLHRRA